LGELHDDERNMGIQVLRHRLESTQTIVRNLIDIVSKGGNYLLNVGPTADGRIPQPSVERLAEVGRWMTANSEAIYGTAASPFSAQLPFGRATSKPGRIYLHVFDWPSDSKLRVPKPAQQIKNAYLLSSTTPLNMTSTSEEITIETPSTAPDRIASVIVLETAGR